MNTFVGVMIGALAVNYLYVTGRLSVTPTKDLPPCECQHYPDVDESDYIRVQYEDNGCTEEIARTDRRD